ncbi:MAG TPA: SigE family RNA polymerase sigma factor [Actinospica sp.]|jgi:RNA polymerase sigma-70 factor (sigma-E family)|nr:SigE family RNA polymerase sigma factor [Actinospica sp.]
MTELRRDAAFTEYVAAKGPWLRKVAYLLCQDWHRADDLVQNSIIKLYVQWPQAERIGNLDGYARRVVVNTFLAEQRSSWWRRVVLHEPEYAGHADAGIAHVETSLDLADALGALPARQRATVVLRYFCDLSVEETATALSCSAGTVKSQTARGLDALRRVLDGRAAESAAS